MQLVTWGIAVECDGGPQEAAKMARQHILDPDTSATTWKVVNMDAGTITVVDIETGVIYESHVEQPDPAS